MTHIATVFLFLLLNQPVWSSTPAFADSPACRQAYQKFNKRFTALEKKYLTISSTSVSEENKPTWTWGKKKKAVYLLHGFIGTPEEMSGVGNALQRQGYTVINDLIPGYGSDGWVANQFTPQTWTTHVEANLSEVRKCFDEIHLIGFSTGGLLLHNYVRRHQNDFSAKSLILYSPFYKPHIAFADFLSSAASLLTPVASTQALYLFTHFPDIKVAVLKPENYLQQIPLDAASYVLNFGSEVDAEISKNSLEDDTTPLLLFVSDTDQIISLDTTLKNVSRDFSNLQIIRFRKSYVPHHLMVKEVSDVADEVISHSTKFILSR